MALNRGPKLRLGTADPLSSVSLECQNAPLANCLRTSFLNDILTSWVRVLCGSAEQSFEELRDQAGAWSRDCKQRLNHSSVGQTCLSELSARSILKLLEASSNTY